MYYTILGSVRQAEVYVVSEKSKVKYSIVMGWPFGSERHVGRTKLAHSVPSAGSHHHSAAPICVVPLSFSPLTNTNGQPILLLRVLLYVPLFFTSHTLSSWHTFPFRVPVQSRSSQSYEPLLLENEREAVADLLQYLESASSFPPEATKFLNLHKDRTTTNFFTGSPLSALTTLSFSDNVDLQRSAALAFAEITEKEVRPVGRDTLDPILFLLSSHDTEVQRAASAALGNLAVNSASTR